MPPQSMTGYGKGSAGNFQVDARSINHKNLDVHLNVPYYLYPYDPEVRKIVRKNFERGRVEIFIPKNAAESVRLKVNAPLVKEYVNAFSALKEEFSLSGDISVDLIASQRDVFMTDDPEIEVAEFYEALQNALDALKTAREEEGINLMSDIRDRVGTVEERNGFVSSRREEVAGAVREKLNERLKELLGDTAIDETRLIQEAAFIVERSDITEEIIRIKSHLEGFKKTMAAEGAIGKKLDFFIQELRREVNTIGSKSQDVEILNAVVEMKHELEKVKEQVQNLQ